MGDDVGNKRTVSMQTRRGGACDCVRTSRCRGSRKRRVLSARASRRTSLAASRSFLCRAVFSSTPSLSESDEEEDEEDDEEDDEGEE